MENKLLLTSPMPPSVNHYTKVHVINRNGKPLPVVYETDEARQYKERFKKIVQEAVKDQNWSMPVNDTQHFYIDAVFYFDRVDKDAANYEKCLSDTITETQLIWKDDNVVCFRTQRIYYDKENPRIELTIHPVDYAGIFDAQLELNEFEDTCKTCSRYVRNCSILRNAKEGRVEAFKYIDDESCIKYKEKK